MPLPSGKPTGAVRVPADRPVERASAPAEAPADQVPDWRATKLAHTGLERLLDQRAAFSLRLKDLKGSLEVLDIKIRGLMERHEVRKVRCGRWQPVLFVSHKPKRIDPTRLLEEGVRQSVIERCTLGGEEYETFRVIDLGEPKG